MKTSAGAKMAANATSAPTSEGLVMMRIIIIIIIIIIINLKTNKQLQLNERTDERKNQQTNQPTNEQTNHQQTNEQRTGLVRGHTVLQKLLSLPQMSTSVHTLKTAPTAPRYRR